MWAKEYRDTPPDSPLKKDPLEPGHGIIGCEMHEINGWGEAYQPPSYKKTWIRRLFETIFLRQ